MKRRSFLATLGVGSILASLRLRLGGPKGDNYLPGIRADATFAHIDAICSRCGRIIRVPYLKHEIGNPKIMNVDVKIPCGRCGDLVPIKTQVKVGGLKAYWTDA